MPFFCALEYMKYSTEESTFSLRASTPSFCVLAFVTTMLSSLKKRRTTPSPVSGVRSSLMEHAGTVARIIAAAMESKLKDNFFIRGPQLRYCDDIVVTVDFRVGISVTVVVCHCKVKEQLLSA